jgi:hypothetical protein
MALMTTSRPTGNPVPPAQELDLARCEHLWSVSEVSTFLGVPIATLHQWRYRGCGPDAFRVGKHLRYDPEAVRRWLLESCRDRAS